MFRYAYLMARSVPVPSVQMMIAIVLGLAILEGLVGAILSSGAVREDAAYAAHLTGYIVGTLGEGAIAAVVILVVARIGRNVRFQEPKEPVIFVGTVIYLLGLLLGVYLICIALYVAAIDPPGGIGAAFLLANIAVFYWFAGRAVSYVLGH